MERSRRQCCALVALDLGVDTSTPAGEMMANVLASFAQYERRLIGQRTREALAVKKTQGVKIGRPRTLPENIRERIREERTNGLRCPRPRPGLTGIVSRPPRAAVSGTPRPSAPSSPPRSFLQRRHRTLHPAQQPTALRPTSLHVSTLHRLDQPTKHPGCLTAPRFPLRHLA
jgi:hypothetical protein